MDKVLKQRLIGASILIALAVIFIPMFFDAPQNDRVGREMTIDLPDPPSDRAQVRRMPLDPDRARRPDPEPASEPAVRAVEPREIEPERRPEAAAVIADIEDRLQAADEPASETAAETEPDRQPDLETVSEREAAEPAVVETEPEMPERVAPDTSEISGWFVQVASFGSTVTAGEVVDRLTSLGHVAHVDLIERGEARLHRVRTGPYANRADADRARDQIQRTVVGVEPIVRGGPAPEQAAPVQGGYSVQVGSFASRNNALRLLSQLEDQGFEAIVHEEVAGSRTIWRVRVGQLSSREAAEQLRAELIERAGLEGLVVSHP
jgi:DedD protein